MTLANSVGSPGGQVNLSTRSGSNLVHGTAWEFNRNDAFTALNGFQPRFPGVKPPRLNRNQYGANLGGPVWIPKIYNGKNKTFFFFNWESGRQISGSFGGQALVPPAAFRSGNFSSSSAVIIDPTTRIIKITASGGLVGAILTNLQLPSPLAVRDLAMQMIKVPEQAVFLWADELAKQMKPNEHFIYDQKKVKMELTEEGRRLARWSNPPGPVIGLSSFERSTCCSSSTIIVPRLPKTVSPYGSERLVLIDE